MLTDLQRRKQRNLFAIHDVDGDGYLREDDWKAYTRKLCAAKGVGPGSPEYDAILAGFASMWQDVMGRADASGDGRIDFDEWCSVIGEVLEDGDRYAGFVKPIVDSVFSMLDQDGDGMISEEEYSAVWQAGAHEGAAVYRRLRGDGARGMSINEMRNLLERFFRSQDPDEPANLFFGPLTR